MMSGMTGGAECATGMVREEATVQPTRPGPQARQSESVAAVIANVRVEYVILLGLSALRMRVWSESSTRWRAPPSFPVKGP